MVYLVWVVEWLLVTAARCRSRLLSLPAPSILVLDCLDFYFTDKPDVEYIWGHYFGGGYWELPEEKYPTQAQLLAYARELEARVVKEFSALCDEDLLKPYARGDDATTWLGHYIYAVRHTMHHHGQLAVLLAEQSIEGGSWY